MKKSYIYILLVLVLFASSCKKFLTEEPKGLITNSNFYQTDADAIAAVNGVYQAMRIDVGNGIPPIYMVEIISDDGALTGTALGERLELENVVYNSQHSFPRQIWTNAYRAIDRANNVLLYVYDSTKIKPAVIRRVRAEAKFLRAFNYFRLVQLYGDVPLMLEPADISKNNLLPPRAPSVEVYNTIIQDLKEAETNLDDFYDYANVQNGGRATKVAAKALLGKVYLTMAGFPIKDASKYQLAADKLKEIVDNKSLYNVDLNTNYANIFSAAVATKNADRERIYYSRGTAGLAAELGAFTRMKWTYVQFGFVKPSTDFVNYNFTAGTSTYVPLATGTNVPTVQADDAISGALPIGFSFNYGGIRYNNFYMSSNGFISFISRANTAPNISTVTDPVIGPLMDNLNGTGGVATYSTSGTAPNRVLTVEWKNWTWKAGTTASKNISFQVKLYESDGKMEMLYNQVAPAVNTPATAVGIRTPTYYVSIRNTATAPAFTWVQSNSTYSASVAGFQPGQIFTIAPNPNGIFEFADPRRNVSINIANPAQIVKYNDQVNTATFNDNADDFHWIRYSDVLLMYAEALMEIGGSANMDLALTQINAIRRAHGGTIGTPAVQALPDYTYSSQADLRDKIRLERRRELLFEGHRWYDLKRWNIMVDNIKNHLSSQYARPLSDYNYITPNIMFLPIPYSDMLNNPNLVQNPGY